MPKGREPGELSPVEAPIQGVLRNLRARREAVTEKQQREAGETPQWVGAGATLAGNLGLVPSFPMMVHNHP